MMDLTFYEYIAAVLWNRQGLGVSVPYVGVWSGPTNQTYYTNLVSTVMSLLSVDPNTVL